MEFYSESEYNGYQEWAEARGLDIKNEATFEAFQEAIEVAAERRAGR